jgi:hypothetical protein
MPALCLKIGWTTPAPVSRQDDEGVARLVGKRHLLRFSVDSEQSNSGQWIDRQSRRLAEQTPTPHYPETLPVE